jgi:hypothetical protein
MRFPRSRLVLPLLASAAAALGGDAMAGGPLPGQELGTQPGAVDPASFASSDVCRNCHFSGAPSEAAYLPSDTWAGTMMANAMRDPVFLAALTVANQDEPGIGTFCIRCHSPLAFVRGSATADPTGAAALADPIDVHGVSCEACHRMNEDPLDDGEPFLIGNARIHVDDVPDKRGPWVSCTTAPDDPTCSLSPGHETVQSPAHASSALCGQCHQVTLPGRKLRDARGVETEEDFPVDTTWAEWKASAFAGDGEDARSCQDCHMARDVDGAVCTTFDATERTGPPQHAFVGGNHWGIQAVMEAYPERAAEYPSAFDTALDRTLTTLQSAAAVTVTGSEPPTEAGGAFTITVRVENLTGHKLPTGYAESRRAWIAVSFVAGEEEVFALGGYDASTGTIEGEGETHVYQARHGRWDGERAVADHHLALHDVIVEDTRIPPRGFVADATTMPVGAIDYDDGEGGLRHFDEVELQGTIPAGLPAGPGVLRATLFYQSMTREHVEFLAAENRTDERGTALADIYEATDGAPPIAIARAEVEITIPDPGGTGGGGGAGPATSSASAGAGTTSATALAATSGGGGTLIDEESQGSGDDGCGCRAAGSDLRGRGLVAVLPAAAAIAAALRRRRSARAAATR